MTSWNQYVREHKPPTYRAAWRILRHAQDCEYVLQKVFIEAHELFERGEINHPRTFPNRLVTFRAIDLLRERRTTDSIDDSPQDSSLQDPAQGPEMNVVNEEESLRLRSVVADLPPRQAAMFCPVLICPFKQ